LRKLVINGCPGAAQARSVLTARPPEIRDAFADCADYARKPATQGEGEFRLLVLAARTFQSAPLTLAATASMTTSRGAATGSAVAVF
jgi:hypothetical protein